MVKAEVMVAVCAVPQSKRMHFQEMGWQHIMQQIHPVLGSPCLMTA